LIKHCVFFPQYIDARSVIYLKNIIFGSGQLPLFTLLLQLLVSGKCSHKFCWVKPLNIWKRFGLFGKLSVLVTRLVTQDLQPHHGHEPCPHHQTDSYNNAELYDG